MALWNNTDEAQSAPKHTVNIVNGETGVEAYGKTPVGTFGIDTAEADRNADVTHAGWTLRTVGSGGRAGRIISETLVAMGSITGDGDIITPISGTFAGEGLGPLSGADITGVITYSDGSTGNLVGVSVITAPEYTGTMTGTVEFGGTEYDATGTIELTFSEEGNAASWIGGTFTATTEDIPSVGVLTLAGDLVAEDAETGASSFTGTVSN